MITNQTTSLNGMVLYYPLIGVWSGTVKVTRETDLASAKANLPPEDLVSDGRKRVIAKEPLAVFLAIRKRVERLLGNLGIRLLGGFAVPVESTAEIEAELPKLEQEFLSARNELIADLDLHYLNWEVMHPGWADFLSRERPKASVVEARCAFHVGCIRAESPDISSSAAAATRFNAIANAALPTLLQETAERAEKLLGEFTGKVSCTQKSVASVRRLVDKLDAFAFLDQRVRPMVDVMQSQFNRLAKTGPIDALGTTTLLWVLKQLADPETMLQHGQGTVDAQQGLPVSIGDVDLLSDVGPMADDVEDVETVAEMTLPPVQPSALAESIFEAAF